MAEEESRNNILTSLQDDISKMREAAVGGPIRDGLKFIRHVVEKHPPRCEDTTFTHGSKQFFQLGKFSAGERDRDSCTTVLLDDRELDWGLLDGRGYDSAAERNEES